MRLLLRIVACITLVVVVITIMLLVRVWQHGLDVLLSVDRFGHVVVLSLLLTSILGPIAAVQLWRLRPSGRVTSAVVWVNIALHQLGLLCFRTPSSQLPQAIMPAALSLSVLAVLLIPAARRTCSSADSPPDGPPSGP